MTECGRCGDCCEDIYFNRTKKWARGLIVSGDPRDPERWQRWLKTWAESGVDMTTVHQADYTRNYLDALFIVKHWHGGKRAQRGATQHWTCDAFDPETRLCTAHADRPPLCSDYPWYGNEPGSGKKGLPLRCSFWADYTPEQRPAEWVPVTFVKITEG
jgi:Fe-S-cluster containining protein